MIKKIGFATALSALLLSGCGGGGSDKSTTDKLKETDGIIIIHGTKKVACPLFIEFFKKEGLKNITSDTPSNSITCVSYGRINNEDGDCLEVNFSDALDKIETEDVSILADDSQACVIGGNK